MAMNAPYLLKMTEPLVSVTTSMPPAVELQGVSKIFGARNGATEVAALADINLSMPEGQIVGIIGRSGAGKSTLIRLINGLERPSQGRVLVEGVDIVSLNERDLRQARRSIGMIFQHFNLLSSRTVFGNVALPLEIAGVPKDTIKSTVEPLLDMVGLADKRDRYPAELSGGQKQRVGIARALATRPKVLLSDEATSALDPETTEQILALLKQVNRELSLTIVLITHEMSVVKSIADRVAVLEDGRIVEEGETFDVFARPQHPTTRRFVGSITGANVPVWLQEQLKADYRQGDRAVLRLTLSGGGREQAVLSRLTQLSPVDVELLHSKVDSVNGRPFGGMIVAIAADGAAADALVKKLDADGIATERLGYVA